MAPKRQRKDAHKATEESLVPVDQALQAHRINLQGGGQGILLGFRIPKVCFDEMATLISAYCCLYTCIALSKRFLQDYFLATGAGDTNEVCYFHQEGGRMATC